MSNSDVRSEVLRFGALLAHQLKNPLTALSLNLEELTERFDGTDYAKIAAQSHAQVMQMNKLIEQIFALWQLAVKEEITSIDLVETTKSVTKNFEKEFRNSNRTIEISKAEKLFVLGCAQLEAQVLAVLIDNSLKHGAGRTKISISKKDQFAEIRIQDEGAGINPRLKSRLMSFGATTTGNGVGLAWAKNQVLHDGGRLEVTSFSPAVFSLYLKLDPVIHGFDMMKEEVN